MEHQDEWIVVVEYVTNGTLREHLDCKFLMHIVLMCGIDVRLYYIFDMLCIIPCNWKWMPVDSRLNNSGKKGKILDLASRLDIAIDVAHAVTYLHMYSGLHHVVDFISEPLFSLVKLSWIVSLRLA